ncbi:hypothetical protein TNCV_2962091 [Trichonephila clavipes]|nr:hypothetical protein TNCV_2962091 [Trichonephila clavipes]
MDTVACLYSEDPPTWEKRVALQQWSENELHPVRKLPLEFVHERQYCRLKYQTNVQIWSQVVWDSHKCALAVIESCSQSMSKGIGPVCPN